MKTIGLLGGMSWESTALYYQQINTGIRHHLGGLHSAKIVLVSVDFHDLEIFLAAEDWISLEKTLISHAQQVAAAGADVLLICTNTMHKFADKIQENLSIPILHLADATANKIKQNALQTVGLLGTRVTMEGDFYRGRLIEKHGLDVLTPSDEEMDRVNDIIFGELCQGVVCEKSRKEYQRIIEDLHRRGAEAVILGCTEICILIGEEHTAIPLFDTTDIHAQAAVADALNLLR